jgi:hypothetical protein
MGELSICVQPGEIPEAFMRSLRQRSGVTRWTAAPWPGTRCEEDAGELIKTSLMSLYAPKKWFTDPLRPPPRERYPHGGAG